MDKRYFSDKIVEWYLNNSRKLPWRDTKNPYNIWLSEIILQQTRVNQGLPYYQKFVAQYPAVEALANAPEQEVLRMWQGLGYYTRARNLHKCAKTVAQLYKGTFPNSYQQLKTLPGIGEYTAAAIASISFKEAVAVVDGNVFRVLSRIYGIETPINSPKGKIEFTTLANNLIPSANPDVYNQAVMEFGALFCTPKNPSCEACIFKKTCFAYKNNLQQALPVKLKLKASRKRHFYYIVFQKGNKILMKERDGKDIWHGLYDFYLAEREKPVKPEKLLKEKEIRKLISSKADIKISNVYKHILTHQTILTYFIIVKADTNAALKEDGLKFYTLAQVADLPKPVLVSKFLADEYAL